MSRYVNVLQTGLPAEQAGAIISQYLQAEGFKYMNERGEMVWRKGVGALANPQFIKAEPAADGTVRVEAWTAGVSLVPGVYGGEMNPMEGVWGWGVKMALKPRVLELERRLGGVAAAQSYAAAPASGTAPIAEAPTVPAAWYPDPARRHELRYWDGTAWTVHVSDAGSASVDPLGAR